jgi:conjugal transfer pilus assembly protein TraF
MKGKQSVIVASILSLLAAPVVGAAPVDQGSRADDFYCGERKLGTWFYCERPKPAVEQTAEQAPGMAKQPTGPAALAELQAVQRELEERKALAIMYPTPIHIAEYIGYQRQQLDRASTFADQWQRTIWQTPNLDYTLQRPVSTLGKRTWSLVKADAQRQTLNSLAQRYGIFYFFSSDCAACEAFSPVLKSLSTAHGFPVMAVSMDGGSTPSFPNFVVDNGQYELMGLVGRNVPALVLFDSVTTRPIPIGYGVMAADEIEERIFQLTQVEPGSYF